MTGANPVSWNSATEADRQRIEWLIEHMWGPERPNEPPTSAIWTILDGARHQRVYESVRYSGMERVCLYAGALPRELAEAAPYLVRLSRKTLYAREVLTEAWGNSWGIFFSTSAPLEKLRNHFRSFLRVRDEEGRRLVFRYYDPRVFREYLPTCTIAELNAVFGPVDKFFVEARDTDTVLDYTRVDDQLQTTTFRIGESAPRKSRLTVRTVRQNL